ncbi:hypothetical protein BJ322DRAFT_1107440 [Thelephora terrestris]|uniref:Protein kinase domain-containing protein n=1 Tax=Thelephora terrestris TaxID=56493 RepID=A0A9P6HHZ6_9AGAM|nr:hypothetical protein BJ322DRAFT_1107440 [Thelephora terrestris]
MSQFYFFAFPHPSIESIKQIRRLRLSPEDSLDLVRERLQKAHPNCFDDLETVTFYRLPNFARARYSLREIYEWIGKRDAEASLADYDPIATLFPEGPQPPEWIDIVVVTHESKFIEQADTLGDPYGNLRHMKARAKSSRAAGSTRSPSDSVKSFAAIKSTVLDAGGLYYGRHDRFGPHTALFNKELALLKYEIDHPEQSIPDETILAHAITFVQTAAKFFDGEITRESQLHPMMETLLGSKGNWQQPTNSQSAKPDVVWSEEGFACLIAEIKNEQGLGGDPFLQSLVVYKKFIREKKYQQSLGRSNFPVILLAIAGDRLVVSTAIFTDSVYANELFTMTLRLSTHFADDVSRVACLFMAVKQCITQLRKLYKNLILNAEGVPPARVLWPNPTADPSVPNGTERMKELHLEFFSKLDRQGKPIINQGGLNDEDKQHPMYLATMRAEDDSEATVVLVKFATKYNEGAHRLLASQTPPLAPTLHACVRVIGDMFMVVMQYVSPSDGMALADIPEPRHPNADAVRPHISKALDLLHAKEFVFGDLREQNVLYLSDGRILLVDFDGVGVHETSRYSVCLNIEAGLGVRRNQIMDKSHDLENFERLMRRLSPQ